MSVTHPKPEIDLATVEIACELIVQANKKMGALYDEIGNLCGARSMHLQALFLAIGRDMLANGQKTKRVGPYVIEAGMRPVRFCSCHGAYITDCDTVGEVTVLKGADEPYITVRELRAAGKAEDDAS